MQLHFSRKLLLIGCSLTSLMLLGACGGGGGVNSTPPPPPIAPPPPSPPPPPPPPPTGTFITDEYLRSNAVVQSGAIAAYNAGATGRGVVAAVIDSGIDTNSAEFAGRIHAASADLAGMRGLQDEGGHGTAVSSVLLGAKNDSGTHGVAFNAQLLVARTDTAGSCANVDPSNSCTHNDNAIARGVDLAVANRARVINISLGGSPANSNLRAAIGRATAVGIVIVISAGNDGVENPAVANNPDLFAQIANDPIANNLVLIAGSLDASNTALSGFSNKAGNGASHYLGALGSRVRSIDENGVAFFFSGTSFSAPVISGAVALLAEAFPNLTGSQIVDLLFRTATDLGASGVDGEFGRGALDLVRAFAPQGATSLAGSAILVPLGTTAGTTSAPIGDAGKTGFSAVFLDSLGRAYTTQIIGASSSAGLTRHLAQGLSLGARSFGIDQAGVSATLSVAQASNGSTAAERVWQSGAQAQSARILAGQIVARLGPKTVAAFGISQSGLALGKDYRDAQSTAFLIGRSATTNLGFDARSGSALAFDQGVGEINLSFAGERGTVPNFDPSRGARSPGRDHHYAAFSVGAGRAFGPLHLSGHATMLRENGTLLGAQFSEIFGVKRTNTLFADANIRLTPVRNWQFGAALRQGWTRVGPGGVRDGMDQLESRAWSFDVARGALLAPDDSLALRISQPLRITSGTLALRLPTDYDYASQTATFGVSRLNLAPDGREINVEAAYTIPLSDGVLSSNIFWRNDPGNIARAHDDLGVALRFNRRF